MTSLVQAWCSVPGRLERGIARLSDPPPAPRCWAEPPQVSGHQSVPEKAWGGTRGSGKQPQGERRRWRYGKTRPKTAGGRKPGDDFTKVLQKDVVQVKNIWKLLTWTWMTGMSSKMINASLIAASLAQWICQTTSITTPLRWNYTCNLNKLSRPFFMLCL